MSVFFFIFQTYLEVETGLRCYSQRWCWKTEFLLLNPGSGGEDLFPRRKIYVRTVEQVRLVLNKDQSPLRTKKRLMERGKHVFLCCLGFVIRSSNVLCPEKTGWNQ